MSVTLTFSACATCGGTLLRFPDCWVHTSQPEPDHRPDPDDGAVSGPDRDDLPRCTGCGHPEHTDGEELCEECVGTGLYGSDGVEVTRWCPCPGPAPAVLGPVSPDPWTDPDAAARAVPPPF